VRSAVSLVMMVGGEDDIVGGRDGVVCALLCSCLLPGGTIR
jgi:hypothetical protein